MTSSDLKHIEARAKFNITANRIAGIPDLHGLDSIRDVQVLVDRIRALEAGLHKALELISMPEHHWDAVSTREEQALYELLGTEATA